MPNNGRVQSTNLKMFAKKCKVNEKKCELGPRLNKNFSQHRASYPPTIYQNKYSDSNDEMVYHAK